MKTRQFFKALAALSLVVTMVVATGVQTVFAAPSISGNSAVVYTTQDLIDVLKNKSITEIKLGNNITLDKTGLVIANGRQSDSLVIDGNGYTLTENKTSGTAYAIQLTATGTLKNITLRNMKIEGKNAYGTVYVGDAVKDVKLNYSNVEYSGPVMAYNKYGDILLQNVTARQVNAKNYMMLARSVTYDGNVTLDRSGVSAATGIIEYHSSPVTNKTEVRPNAVVTITNSDPKSFYANNRYESDILVGEGAVFDYKGQRQLTINNDFNSIMVEKNATFRLNLDLNSYTNDEIMEVQKGILVKENAVFDVLTNGKRGASIEVIEADGDAKFPFRIEVLDGATFKVVSLNDTGTEPVVSVDRGNDLIIKNPAYFLVYNSSASTYKYSTAIKYEEADERGNWTLDLGSVRFWKSAANSGGPEQLANPTQSWVSQTPFHTVISLYKYVITDVKSDYAGSEPLNKDSFKLLDQKIVEFQGRTAPVEKTLSYDANGGVGSYSETVAANSAAVVKSAMEAGISRANFEFLGWNTSPDGSGTSYAAGGSITVSDDITLYAQWKDKQRTVTYHDNSDGKTMVESALLGENYLVKEVSAANFTMTDGTFVCWNTSADGTGKDYYPGDQIVITENLQLYAKWQMKPVTKFTVTYIAPDYSVYQVVEVKEGDTHIIIDYPDENFGYWYNQDDETWDAGSTIVVTEDITLYAHITG